MFKFFTAEDLKVYRKKQYASINIIQFLLQLRTTIGIIPYITQFVNLDLGKGWDVE